MTFKNVAWRNPILFQSRVKWLLSMVSEGINILCHIFGVWRAMSSTPARQFRQLWWALAHATESNERFFISQQTMRELVIISHDFSKIQANVSFRPINVLQLNSLVTGPWMRSTTDGSVTSRRKLCYGNSRSITSLVDLFLRQMTLHAAFMTTTAMYYH